MPFLPRAEAPFLLGATGLYLLAMLLSWAQLFLVPNPGIRPETPAKNFQPQVIAQALLWFGVVLHLAALAGQGPALFMQKGGVAGLFGCILILSYLMFGHRLGQGSGAIVTPVALGAALFSVVSPTLHPVWTPPGRPDSYWLAAHVIIILAGYVALAFAFAASLLYLVQEGLLKRKKLTGLWRKLPSLQTADDWIYRATAFGLALLTVGIISGVGYSAVVRHAYSVWQDPKVLFSLATWLTFAVYIATRVKFGWHGRKSSMVVIYGFVLLVISFLGTPHLLENSPH